MDPITFPLTIHNGHLLLRSPSGDWVVDTGAPNSFGRAEPRLGLGEDTVGSSYMGSTTNTLGEFLGAAVTGLLGADLLARQDLVIDWAEGRVELGTVEPESHTREIPVGSAGSRLRHSPCRSRWER